MSENFLACLVLLLVLNYRVELRCGFDLHLCSGISSDLNNTFKNILFVVDDFLSGFGLEIEVMPG